MLEINLKSILFQWHINVTTLLMFTFLWLSVEWELLVNTYKWRLSDINSIHVLFPTFVCSSRMLKAWVRIMMVTGLMEYVLSQQQLSRVHLFTALGRIIEIKKKRREKWNKWFDTNDEKKNLSTLVFVSHLLTQLYLVWYGMICLPYICGTPIRYLSLTLGSYLL